MYTFLALTGAFVAYATFRGFQAFQTNRRYIAEAKRRGCKDPATETGRYPLGIDQLLEAIKASKEQILPDLFLEWFEEAGAWTTRYSILSGEYSFFTCDPKNIQAILATQFDDFCLGDRRIGNVMPLLGNGIFTQDGKAWEHSRAMMRPQFAREQISNLDLEERHVHNLMRALPVGEEGWSDLVDLQVLFFRLTLDSSTEFLFGESVDSQIAALSGYTDEKRGRSSALDERVFAHAFDTGQKWLSHRNHFQDWYWLITSKEFRTACKQTHAFVDQFVERALKEEAKEKELEGGGKEKYVLSKALVAETRDPLELRSQLLNILLAGRDTTASHLGWVFYLLVRHPRVFQKLRSIVIETFGTYNDPRNISFATLKSCQYLQYCNNETLRLYPVVPANGRVAVRDTTIPSGGGPDGQSPIFIRKGQVVDYTVYAMHRRKDLWGPDALEFKPERWEGMKQSWNYLPFNGGPRICLGREFTGRVSTRTPADCLSLQSNSPSPRHHMSLSASCNGLTD